MTSRGEDIALGVGITLVVVGVLWGVWPDALPPSAHVARAMAVTGPEAVAAHAIAAMSPSLEVAETCVYGIEGRIITWAKHPAGFRTCPPAIVAEEWLRWVGR